MALGPHGTGRTSYRCAWSLQGAVGQEGWVQADGDAVRDRTTEFKYLRHLWEGLRGYWGKGVLCQLFDNAAGQESEVRGQVAEVFDGQSAGTEDRELGGSDCTCGDYLQGRAQFHGCGLVAAGTGGGCSCASAPWQKRVHEMHQLKLHGEEAWARGRVQ